MRVPRSLGWLWLLVALQIAIPASYYLIRQDRDDERFAWRMFSAIRLQRCAVSAFDVEAQGARPITLSSALHASWIRSLERGRRRVIEHFLATRCHRSATRAAWLERRCVGASGRAQSLARYRYECAAGRFEVER